MTWLLFAVSFKNEVALEEVVGRHQWRVRLGQASPMAVMPEIGIPGEGNRLGDQLTASSGGG